MSTRFTRSDAPFICCFTIPNFISSCYIYSSMNSISSLADRASLLNNSLSLITLSSSNDPKVFSFPYISIRSIFCLSFRDSSSILSFLEAFFTSNAQSYSTATKTRYIYPSMYNSIPLNPASFTPMPYYPPHLRPAENVSITYHNSFEKWLTF